jgi:hypothetical protein
LITALGSIRLVLEEIMGRTLLVITGWVVFCLSTARAAQESPMTVTGTLVRSMGIGGESTGWAIKTDRQVTVQGKPVSSIAAESSDPDQFEKLKNKHVRATGKLSTGHGTERGDWPVLKVSSIVESANDQASSSNSNTAVCRQAGRERMAIGGLRRQRDGGRR